MCVKCNKIFINNFRNFRNFRNCQCKQGVTNIIITVFQNSAFKEANQVLDAFVKDLRKTGKIAGVVHKKPITKQQIQRLYECGELGPANSTNPAQLQRTVWFYLVLYFGQRGRENQRQMKSNMLVFRKTPQGKEHSTGPSSRPAPVLGHFLLNVYFSRHK